MYSDLASLYERAGCIHGLPGTLTQLPILTMPADDISHPIADLTGYITEGQIVLDRELDRRGVYPPVRLLPSLSRLMNAGTGAGFTHADHPALANQLFACYARAMHVRVLASGMGEEGLSEVDRRFLVFGQSTLNHEQPVNPTPEARACTHVHQELLGRAAELAACSVNLRRLLQDYIRTERRAKAIENVLMPEIVATLKIIEEQLEGIDQEEIARLRRRRGDVG